MIAMIMAGIGMATRAVVSDTWSLLGLSALALAGMGIGNVVIPPLVKRYFSDRLALMSSVYIVGVQIGTIVPRSWQCPWPTLPGGASRSGGVGARRLRSDSPVARHTSAPAAHHP